MTDVMDRLRAADPLAGQEERLDAEAEALLARLRATPPAAPRRSRRRLAIAALAGAAALGVAVLASWPDRPDDALAARVAAAVTQPDSVYHVVARQRATESRPLVVESWHASDGRFHERYRATVDGALLQEVAGRRPGALLRYDPERDAISEGGIVRDPGAPRLAYLDPARDPGRTLGRLHAQGVLRSAGETSAGYRLVSDERTADGEEWRFEYVVDRETSMPVAQRITLRRGDLVLTSDVEFLRYERLPLDARSRDRLALDPHPGAACSRGARALTREALGFPNPCA